MRIRPSAFRRDQRGFTGAEKALIICFALAIIALVAALLSSGSGKAGKDAKRALEEGGKGTAASIGGLVPNAPSAGGGDVGKPGEIGKPGEGEKPGEGGKAGEGNKEENPKYGSSGEIKYRKDWKHKDFEDKKFGGAKNVKEEEKKDYKKGAVDWDVKFAEAKKEWKKEGALKEFKPIGKEKVELGYGKVGANVNASASWKEGVQAGGGVEAKVGLIRETGGYTLPGDVKEAHEVNVLDAQAGVNGTVGVSKNVVGGNFKAEASANLIEGKVEAKKEWSIPFLPFKIETGGELSGAVGAQASAEGKAGYFKGQDGKSKLGFNFGGKLGLGLGGGFKLGFNIVW